MHSEPWLRGRTDIDAYAADGHVLFNVPSMPDYGKLSGHNRDELIAGARVEIAPYKKDPADFVLWKPSADDQPGFGWRIIITRTS